MKLEEADTGPDEPTDEIGFAQSRTGTQSRGNRSTSVMSPGLRSNTPPKIDKRLTEIYVSVVYKRNILYHVHMVWKWSSKWDFHSYTYPFILNICENKLDACLQNNHLNEIFIYSSLHVCFHTPVYQFIYSSFYITENYPCFHCTYNPEQFLIKHINLQNI